MNIIKLPTLILTFLFLLVGSSVVFGDDFQDGVDAYQKKDHKEAVKWYRLAAEQWIAQAQFNLGVMYDKGQGVPQDKLFAHMWWDLAGSKGNKNAIKNRNIIVKKMSPSQIEKAQEMARNWKPTTK